VDGTLQKVSNLFKIFNDTFEISANIEDDVVNGLVIDGLKNNGHDFIAELFETFNTIVTAVSDDHELIYNNEKGIVLAKKVVSVDYVVEE